MCNRNNGNKGNKGACAECGFESSAPVSEVEELFGPVIYAYTREQAIKDGVLIDVTATAKEAGIKYQTAVSEALWNGYIVPGERLKFMGQSEMGRLWDVLTLFVFSVRSSPRDCSELYYNVLFLTDNEVSCQHETIKIKAVCGPSDDCSPCITLMLENED